MLSWKKKNLGMCSVTKRNHPKIVWDPIILWRNVCSKRRGAIIISLASFSGLNPFAITVHLSKTDLWGGDGSRLPVLMQHFFCQGGSFSESCFPSVPIIQEAIFQRVYFQEAFFQRVVFLKLMLPSVHSKHGKFKKYSVEN